MVIGDCLWIEIMEIIIIRVDVIGSLSFIDFVFILINERMEIKIVVMLSKDVLF